MYGDQQKYTKRGEMNKLEKGISPGTLRIKKFYLLASQEEEENNLGLSVLSLLSHPMYCHKANEREILKSLIQSLGGRV